MKKKKRPSPRLQGMLRQLRRRNELLAVSDRPRPDCAYSISHNGVVYCDHRKVRVRVGGSAVRCIGVGCGVSEVSEDS